MECKTAPKIVAEIGCNHMGDIKIARKMIERAALCGANYAKFQKRTVRELLTDEEYNKPYESRNSFGKTYGEHRDFLEFSAKQHRELYNHCNALGIGYACSVWDLTSAREIAELNPDYIKIPSAMNLCFEIYDCLFENYRGDIHVSLGMTTEEERNRIYQYFSEKGRIDNLVFYHCCSAYPAKFEHLHLLNIGILKKEYPGIEIGYSGHELGISASIVAGACGAEWIERHFTTDRSLPGTDQSASIEPFFLERLVRDTQMLPVILTHRPNAILECEKKPYEKMKKYTLLSK